MEGGKEGGELLMNPWAWIGDYDELSRAMETGYLLFGFHEVRAGGREGGREGEWEGGRGVVDLSFVFSSFHSHSSILSSFSCFLSGSDPLSPLLSVGAWGEGRGLHCFVPPRPVLHPQGPQQEEWVDASPSFLYR